ncbi:MAG TPA: outer membrane protein transport protein [Caulobacteraceae bacterium]
MSRSIFDLSRVSLGALAGASALVAAPSAVLAGAFYVQEQSVRGAGRANSGEAAETGADSLWWNPASIARSGRELYVGAHGRLMSVDFTDQGSTITRPLAPGGVTTPVGGDGDPDDVAADQVIPNAAVALPVSDQLTVGLSVHRPFHLEYDFGDNSWARYDTIANKIEVTNFQGTVALRVNDWVDVGAGVSAIYTDAFLDAAYPNLMGPDGRSSLQAGDAWDYGWTVGAQAHLDRLSLGASYRSSTEHDLDDGRFTLSGLVGPLASANFSQPAQTSFRTPWSAVVAARYQITPQLTLNGQVQRMGWSEYDAVRVTIGGATSAIAQDFEDTTVVAAGADYAISPQWTVRAGVRYEPTPTIDALREPGVADSDRWTAAVGGSMAISPAMSLDLALGYVAFQGDRIYENAVFYPGTGADTTVQMRGRHDGNMTVLSAGLRWKF